MNFMWICHVFFQDYIDAHPETVILDPLPAIRTLLDRCKSYKLIHKLEDCMQGLSTAQIHKNTCMWWNKAKYSCDKYNY